MSCSRRQHQSPVPAPVKRRDPGLRASDSEREEVVLRLREHGAAGRLDIDELEQRISTAYAARTHGDLAALERDLPRVAAARAVPARRVDESGWPAFALVNALLVAIWAFTGAGYFWPGWVIASWGLALVLCTAPHVVRWR